jgi:hypothetical protein
VQDHKTGYIVTKGHTVQDLFNKRQTKRWPSGLPDLLPVKSDKEVHFTHSVWSKIFKKHEEVNPPRQSFREHGGTLIGKIEPNRIVITDVVFTEPGTGGSFQYRPFYFKARDKIKGRKDVKLLGLFHFHPEGWGGIISNAGDDLGLSIDYFSARGKNHINVVFNTFDQEVSSLSFDLDDLEKIKGEEAQKELNERSLEEMGKSYSKCTAEEKQELVDKHWKDIRWKHAMEKAFVRKIRVIPDEEA